MSYGKHDIIRIRRGTASEWSNSLPQPGGEVLKLGEPGYEKDTGKLKIGDGVTPWNSLAYFNNGAPIDPEQLQDLLGGGLLTAGSGISIIYNDLSDTLTISTSGVAFLDSPNFTGNPTAPTAVSGTNTTQIASTAFVRNEISNLLDSAPSTLDTLNELAAALGDDPNFAVTIASGLATKAPLVHTHSSSDITDFNSSVSGLLPTITNSGDNRVLTSIGTTTGINAESNLTFDGTTLAVTGAITVSGNFVASSGNFSSLTVNNTGVSLVGHYHTSSDITDFNSSVSGLLPVTNVSGSGNINVSNSNGLFVISSSGLVESDITGITGASGVNNVVQISQVNYDALVSKDPNTIYFIV